MRLLNNKTLRAISVLCSLTFVPCAIAEVAPLWLQFEAAKANGDEPTLPDFSYAGYDYSESELPDISNWAVFNVADYGAIANDDNYDDQAIQLAIDAAQNAGGGVVMFPAGRFLVSPNETVGENIFIRASNIVLKGAGAGDNGTEIFKVNKKVNNGEFIFEVSPTSTGESVITTVVENAQRESFEIVVADASQLSVGQRILLRADSVELAQSYYSPLTIRSEWTRLLNDGFNLREIHSIAEINGNTVRLREPLHISLTIGSTPIQVRSYNMINNVGIEDIRFKGNWDSYPEDFDHHKDDIHDYAWNALRLDNVENGWIQNVEFKDWNQGIYIDGSAALTLRNITFTGKKGHMSIHTRRSYGVLIKDSADHAGHHHGPGVGYWGCGTVYLRYQMLAGQNIDSHSGSPYATLFDNVTNGHLSNNGGPHESYPHHGKHLVAWNMTLEGGPDSYNFWSASRNGHTFAMPYFIGLQGKSVSFTEGTYSANELLGQMAEPASLFEAQLALRLGSAAPEQPEETEEPEQEPEGETGSEQQPTEETPTAQPNPPNTSNTSGGGAIGGLLLTLLMVLTAATKTNCNIRRKGI